MFEQQITINAPADKVFEYVADLMRHPEWAKYPLQMRATGDGQAGVGSTFESTGRQFGKHTDTVRVTEHVAGSRFCFESTGDGGHVRHTFAIVENTDGSTTLRKSIEFLKPSFATKLFMLVVKRVAPRSLESDLSRIKVRIEGTA